MVANMETIDPNLDPREASASLDAVADAQRAVRDRPWPLWLYPVNTLLLGGLAVTGLAHSSMLAAIAAVILGVGLVALNYGAGRLMGTPFAIPTNRGFRILVALSGAFVIASLVARAGNQGWAIIVCAAGAAISYGLGSVLHYRSTRG
jgi:hypothetical protein